MYLAEEILEILMPLPLQEIILHQELLLQFILMVLHHELLRQLLTTRYLPELEQKLQADGKWILAILLEKTYFTIISKEL